MNKAIYILLSIIVLCSCTEEGSTTIDPPGNSNLTDITITDVSYGNHRRQKYDIHLPAGRDVNTPVILIIHGGAWKARQKEDFNQYINLIKSR